MYGYKYYPTTIEYQNVARQIVATYPFLASPAGTPYVS